MSVRDVNYRLRECIRESTSCFAVCRRWGSLLIYCRLRRRRYYGDAGVNHARSLSTSRIYHSPDETVINYRDCPIGMRMAKRSASPYLRLIRIINLAINSMIFLDDCLRQTYFCQRKNVRWQRLYRQFLIALWWFSSFNVLSQSFTLLSFYSSLVYNSRKLFS